MAWDHLSIDKPHLAYIILGGFTSLFMLVSLLVKEKFYIGEATVATICGVIFGPHAADLLNPASWGNVDRITLEFSRIVLVVQCFAIGVELPKYYMEKHWRSVLFLLVPVMTFGWLLTSLFIWWMIGPLSWLESLACAACVTATDPILASSVVGKGKFARRVPRHLRDLLSAESGCNDGMAFPFIYLAIYLIRYQSNPGKAVYHWAVFTVLYECLFGAFYGVVIGYICRHAIKWSDRHGLVDRESFLVFYFTLAVFCAGSGSLLGLDDLLVGFAAGVGFSNDGWFQAKTEDTHVSNVLDLLLNLSYFVYLGAIIPWAQYSMPDLGVTPWRLVVIAIFVILFRRIPIMMALKPFVPDLKSWREAMFAGHFGPIGVGAIFIAILARAEFETETTTPLAELPPADSKHGALIALIWPITTFLVMSSILIHGSSIAVFTLGKHINTLTLTMSYTQANEDGPSWMNRLPRIQAQGKSSMSLGRSDTRDTTESDAGTARERLPELPPGTLPPTGMPGNFLRRQREEEAEEDLSRQNSRPSSLRASRRKKRWDAGMGPGGPISQSAIAPLPRPAGVASKADSSRDGSSTLQASRGSPGAEDGSPVEESRRPAPGGAIYMEGNELIVEDRDGEVIQDITDPNQPSTSARAAAALKDDLHHPSHPYRNLKRRIGEWDRHRHQLAGADGQAPEQRRGPAMAYQIGNTIIVEDEDGEVIQRYDLPSAHPKRPRHGTSGDGVAGGERAGSGPRAHSFMPNERQALKRMGTWAGLGRHDEPADNGGEISSARPAGDASAPLKADGKRKKQRPEDIDDPRIRFVQGGRRMTKADFIKQIQALDPKARAAAVIDSDVPPDLKQAACELVPESGKPSTTRSKAEGGLPTNATSKSHPKPHAPDPPPQVRTSPRAVSSGEPELPPLAIHDQLRDYRAKTAASQRRQMAVASSSIPNQASTSRTSTTTNQPIDLDRQPKPLPSRKENPASSHARKGPRSNTPAIYDDETAAERRRRTAALGLADEGASGSSNGKNREETVDSEDEGGVRDSARAVQEPGTGDEDDDEENDDAQTVRRSHAAAAATAAAGSGSGSGRIRFADQPDREK